jgi:hypothetical protein
MPEVAVKKYTVRLSMDERARLEVLISKGKHSAAQMLKARIPLKADVSEAGEGWSDSRIVKALDTSEATVFRTRQRAGRGGLRRGSRPANIPRTRRAGKSSMVRACMPQRRRGAKMITLICLPPPKGRAKWSLRLLEDKVVELNIVERASDNRIGRTLKNDLKPHLKKQYAIPPEASAAFVANMEDVLDV